MKKRILATTLALALAMTGTAFAAENDPTSIGTVVFDNGVGNEGLTLFTEDLSGGSEKLGALEAKLIAAVPAVVPNDAGDPTNWPDDKFYDFVVNGEIIPDMKNIRENYGTGADFTFGAFGPTAAPLNTPILSSNNKTSSQSDNYIDVVVFDMEMDSHNVLYHKSKEGWTLSLSRTAFADITNAANTLDATFALAQQEDTLKVLDARTFRGNYEYGFTFSDAIDTDEQRVVAKGSLGYVATRFDAELTLQTKPAEGEYQSEFTWTLESGPTDGPDGND